MKFYQNTTFTNSYAVKRELEDERQCLELEVEGLKKEKAKLDKLKHNLDKKHMYPVPKKKFKTGSGNQ